MLTSLLHHYIQWGSIITNFIAHRILCISFYPNKKNGNKKAEMNEHIPIRITQIWCSQINLCVFCISMFLSLFFSRTNTEINHSISHLSCTHFCFISSSIKAHPITQLVSFVSIRNAFCWLCFMENGSSDGSFKLCVHYMSSRKNHSIYCNRFYSSFFLLCDLNAAKPFDRRGRVM